MAIDKIFNDANVDGIADNIFGAVNNSVSEVKAMQQRKAAENVQMVVEAFKKIETNITEKFDNVTDVIEKRVLTIKDGRDGSSGSDGRNGRDGKPGRDGVNGKQGTPGTPGKDGVDGEDGVSVTNANIDFDGSLVISLSSGQQINVGEVVAPDLAEKIKIVSTMSTNGAVGIKDEGSSISTGVKNINFVGATVTATASGDDVTVNVSAGTGTVQSVAATVPAFLSVAGSPITTTGTLAISLSGTALPVANGGTGITSLGTGVATALGVNTGTAGAFVVNGGALGTPASGTVTNLTGTASININGTVGATTPTTGAFTTLSATGITTLSDDLVVNNAGTVATFNSTNSNGNKITLQDASVTVGYVGATGTGAFLADSGAIPRVSTTTSGAQVTGTLSATGTLSGGTSGTGYSFSGSAPATSLTLNSSGNLGLGVTPSAWGSGERAIQLAGTSFGNGIFSSSNNTGVIVGANAYYSSTGYKRIVAAASSIIQFAVGETRFLTAGSSTADSAITFTQAMTLDASGNLLVGSTSSTSVGEKLLVSGYAGVVSDSVVAGIYAGAAGNKDLNFYSNGNSQFFTAARIRVSGGVTYTDEGFMSFWTTSNNGANVLTTSERARFNSTGALVFAGGTTNADGIGITFPATQSASTNANTLDDYEEGTWTPSIGGTAGYSVQNGTYTKIGRVVTLHCYFGVTSIGTGSTTIMSGAPFTCASYGGDAGSIILFNTGVGGGTFVFLQPNIQESATTFRFTGLTAAASSTTAPVTVFADNAGMAFTITYFV